MGRTRTAVSPLTASPLTASPLTVLSVLSLTGCTGSADPAEPPPPPTAHATPSTRTSQSPATPTPTPTPTPPAMPAAAKAHTQAGAKAFVQYFWNVVNYAQATGDTKAIAALSADGCSGCDAGIASIDRIYSTGGTITGGTATVSKVAIVFGWVGDTAVADATFDVDVAPQVVTDSAGRHRGTARRSRDSFNLLADKGADWRVTDFRSAE